MATWLTSGWVDFGLIVAWMTLVCAVGWRCRERTGDD
jgi:hypothetical protein